MSQAVGSLALLAALLALVTLNAAVASLLARVSDPARPPLSLAGLRRSMGRDDTSVRAADRLAFVMVPALMLVASFVALAPLAFSSGLAFPAQPGGLLVSVAALALGPVALLLVAASADSARDRAAAMRAGVVRAAWLVPVFLSLVTPAMVAGGLDAGTIVAAQRGTWLFGLLPRWFALSPQVVAFALFAVGAHFAAGPLLSGRGSPHGGGHSGAGALLWRFAEVTALFAWCALAVTVFFGGWLVPYVDRHPVAELLGPVVFLVKTYALMYGLARVRAALPSVADARPVARVWTRLVPLSMGWVALYALLTKGGGL